MLQRVIPPFGPRQTKALHESVDERHIEDDQKEKEPWKGEGRKEGHLASPRDQAPESRDPEQNAVT